ncbi:MAG: hypothetical protein US36_C0014G0009 [Candidatus Wolfebacteria bacterium GW2011_GWC1_37_10]|uniref:Nudix hydrolase domain-containing protein n=1 Tax=Candidatus Wolfebacteria bacterium GW2011_GWC1_37_10 TaxID=1619010 RepID=A0A0G0IBZ6_9BACT|nr:MAG: hypothetical protein US36_C0014G0009 [Candidatus Wolfebacteria bacterium GW2011_GWC1_37_10]
MNNAIIKVGVLIESKERLLLIKEQTWQDKKYYWNFIKGTFEPDKDKDLLATAKRESKEEANVRIDVHSILNITYLKKNGVYIQINFIARLVGNKYGLSSKNDQKKFRDDQQEDIIDIRLFTKEELKKMHRKDFIGERTFQTIQDWISGKSCPLNTLRSIKDF